MFGCRSQKESRLRRRGMMCRKAHILAASVLLLAGWAARADTVDLQQYIQDQYQAGNRNIVLPEGEVRIDRMLKLDQSYDGLTITGRGKTTVVMTTITPFMYIYGAKNITLTDFAVDYDPLPFTQGTITEMKGNEIYFRIHDGYPRLSDTYQSKQLLFFDKTTRQWKWEREMPNWLVNMQVLSPDTGKMITGVPADQVAVGDYVCLINRNYAGFQLRELAENVAFRNLTIYTVPGIAINARRVVGRHVVSGVTIKRGPTPRGATEPRLMSVTADAVNYAGCRQGPLIENCDFSYHGDDSVNLHGPTLPVLKVRDDGSFLTAITFRPKDLGKIILPGDQARILAAETFEVLRTAQIDTIEPLESVAEVPLEKVAKVFVGANLSEGGIPSYILYRVKLHGPAPKEGESIDVPAVQCPDFVIRNSKFGNHKARGLRIQANHGVIENCVFENLPQPAIYLGPEYTFWMEAGWGSNIDVTGNMIRNVCQAPVSWAETSYFPGAIVVSGRKAYGRTPFWPGNTDMRIRHNLIDGCSMSGIAILAGSRIDVSDNQIRNVNLRRESQACQKFGIQYRPEAVFQWRAEQELQKSVSH